MRCRIVLVFGEDHNDREALRHLVRALAAGGPPVDVQLRRQPLILARGAQRPKRRRMFADISKLCEFAESASDAIVVAVVHRDCDNVEPAHRDNTREMIKELHDAGVRRPVAATPAWEIEAWWMLFPAALAAVRACWRGVDYGGQSVGRFKDAKQKLIRDLRPIGLRERRRCPDFHESDGIRVARHLKEVGLHQAQGTAVSDSFTAFAAALREALR